MGRVNQKSRMEHTKKVVEKAPAYQFITDDGKCGDHGYFLPKQKAAPLKSVCNSGISSVADISVQDLCAALVQLSKAQAERLSSANLA